MRALFFILAVLIALPVRSHALASRIMVLAGGRVAFLGENRDLSEDEILSRAFGAAA